MPTLISVHNSEGCVGRCDAKCYDAQSDECDCICGGKNHGAGLDRARANTAELAGAELAAKWAESQGLDPRRLQLRAQGELFPFGNEPTTADIRRNLRAAQRRRRELELASELYKRAPFASTAPSPLERLIQEEEADAAEGQP